MTKTRDELIDEFLDREAIRELAMRYSKCIWEADAEGYAELFTEDGVYIRANGDRITGRQSLREFMAGTFRSMKGHKPFIHSHLVELQSRDHATGWLAIDVRLASRGMERASSGCYDDEYRKVGGLWKIRSRKTAFLATTA